MYERTSLIARKAAPAKRDVKKVPFVELFAGRVQGVVSSGSDIKRVYVSYLESGTSNFYCCTNNNRPCGGLRGSSCKHIQSLVDQAILQFGSAAVAAYLGMDTGSRSYNSAADILRARAGSEQKESPGVVFSRFLSYLRFCELEARSGTVHEMSWFVS